MKNEDIKKITAIYLPLDNDVYKYRISAWLYNAIAYNKKIILEQNNLYNYEKKRFPNHVILNRKINFIKYNFEIRNKFNISKYNRILIKKFKKKFLNKF